MKFSRFLPRRLFSQYLSANIAFIFVFVPEKRDNFTFWKKRLGIYPNLFNLFCVIGVALPFCTSIIIYATKKSPTINAIWHRRIVALHQEIQHAMSNRPLKLLCFIIAATLSPGAIFWFWAILLLLLFDGPKGFLFDLALFAGLVIVMAIAFFIGASIKAKFDKRKYDRNLQAYKDEMAKAEKSLPEREAASSGRRL